jgi:hypothetical protein
VILALRLEPGDPYDTYTGYFFDRSAGQWKLYASGRKWHAPGRGRTSVLPGSFVEVPGPPDRERSAHIPRGVDFRGWCRDHQGQWHPIDQMTAGDIRENEPVQKRYELSPDGWFRMVMGGLEQYRYPQSKPVLWRTNVLALPDFMDPGQLGVLDQIPAQVAIKDLQLEDGNLRLNMRISTPGESAQLAIFYGPKDALSFEPRWARRVDVGDLAPGEHTVELRDVGASGVCRALIRGPFGSAWADSSTVYPPVR